MRKSSKDYAEIMSTLKSLVARKLQIVSLENQCQKLQAWIEKYRKFVISIQAQHEFDLDVIFIKKLKIKEIVKKLHDKNYYKQEVLRQVERFHEKENKKYLEDFQTNLLCKWENICNSSKREYQRLHKIGLIWKNYQSSCEQLEQWLSTQLISINVIYEPSSFITIPDELNRIKKIDSELKNEKFKVREYIKNLKRNLAAMLNIQSNQKIEKDLIEIENRWLQIKQTVQEKLNYLEGLTNENDTLQIDELWSNVQSVITVCKGFLEKEKKFTTTDEIRNHIQDAQVSSYFTEPDFKYHLHIILRNISQELPTTKSNNITPLQTQPSRYIPRKRCFENVKLQKKQITNLQKNTHAEMRFPESCKATILKSHFGIGLPL